MLILIDRDIILLCYQQRKNICLKMSGAFGWKASLLRRIFLAQAVQSLVLLVKFVMVVRTKIVWVVSHVGTQPWMRTSIWFENGMKW